MVQTGKLLDSNQLVEDFLAYRSQSQIIDGRRVPPLDIESMRAYRANVRGYLDSLRERGISPEEASEEDVIEYLRNGGILQSTSRRRFAVLVGNRGFLRYLQSKGIGKGIDLDSLVVTEKIRGIYKGHHKVSGETVSEEEYM